MTTVLARNWWALALRGVLAVLFGLIAFLMPGITLAAIVLLFGAYAVVDGIFAIIAAVRAAERHERWWSLALQGVVDILAGIIAFVWPAATALALLFLVAFWAIVTGVLEIVAAVRLRREIQGEWLLILSGILSVAFGGVLLALPAAGILVIVWWIGAYAIVAGVVMIALAFKLRGRQHRAPVGTTGAPRPA
jgi:uncharacterized membrane protein HdeD (DUF308 family)